MESKVRLVRCPKCENLLPELSEYSVYKCGGCGALLRAKARDLRAETETGTETETSSRVSEEASGPSIHVSMTEKSSVSSLGSGGNADEEIEGVVGPPEKPEEDASVPEKMDEEGDPGEGSLPEIEASDCGEEDGPTQTSERGTPVFSEKPDDPPSKSGETDENPKTTEELLRKLEDLNEQLKKLSAGHLLQPNKVSSQCGHGEFNTGLHIHGSHPPLSMSSGGLCHCHQHHPHFSNPCIEMGSNQPPCSFCHMDHWYNPRRPVHRGAHQRPRWHYGIGCEENAGTSLRTCRPVAGAAPFITCFRCLELLRLPSESVNCEGKANAVVCGACAAPIFFTIAEGRRVVFSEERGGARSSPKRVERCVSSVCEHFGSGDLEVQGTAPMSPPLAGSPLQEHFDYSLNAHRGAVAHLVMGSGRKNGALRQGSVKDASVETDGVGNVSSSDSSSREAGNGSSSDSFLFGIKKSLRDLSRLNQLSGKIKLNVSVNGIPVVDKKLKRAEKITGTIQPGQYWYDYRAGFWGVMGGPCLGIVPPYVEELNFPIPKDCSGGTTLVLVNGRELHRKDLELLANRGLPTEPNRSYIIDVSGKVLDRHTGEELDCLGRLAPTIEKMKRGFGMKPPRAAPASS